MDEGQNVGTLVDLYLKEIEEHVLAHIDKGRVGGSCFAAVMLLFAGIDGLGRLLHRDDRIASKCPGPRFKWALHYLGLLTPVTGICYGG